MKKLLPIVGILLICAYAAVKYQASKKMAAGLAVVNTIAQKNYKSLDEIAAEMNQMNISDEETFTVACTVGAFMTFEYNMSDRKQVDAYEMCRSAFAKFAPKQGEPLSTSACLYGIESAQNELKLKKNDDMEGTRRRACLDSADIQIAGLKKNKIELYKKMIESAGLKHSYDETKNQHSISL